MSDFGQERTVDMMTYFHSLPVAKQIKEKRSKNNIGYICLNTETNNIKRKTFINTV